MSTEATGNAQQRQPPKFMNRVMVWLMRDRRWYSALFLGLALALLSIIVGAKVALALMVMGIPILDTALVIINRVRHGHSPSHADKTHLHHRFLATGLNARQICYIL